jgi:hypothetical protein
MTKTILTLSLVSLCVSGSDPVQQQQRRTMSFFITSEGSGKGGDLGGLAGADRHCAELARRAGVTDRTWHAYLSTTASGGQAAVNARDRIGNGPWYNAKGVLIGENVAQLHGDNSHWTKETALNEKGEVVKGRGDTPNQHDLLTGSNLDGTAISGSTDTTCGNWTSSAADASGQVGHFDKTGGGQNPTSWNSAHASRGCGLQNLQATGGNGYFYCFAI